MIMPKVLKPNVTDLGEFSVARVLPNPEQRMVGPFVFFDHMGPVEFDAGAGVNVRPHPHIGLATVTYLLEGCILHRDSLGNCLEIRPGDVNWMVAGRGVTHSERESLEVRSRPHSLNGLQCWVALPREFAEVEPSFLHVSNNDLPHKIVEGVTIRLVVGEAFGLQSQIKTFSPMFMVDILANKGELIERPNPDHECLVYVAEGGINVGGAVVGEGATAMLPADADIHVLRYSRLVLLGGERWTEMPNLEWNFVSFDQDRIEQAKRAWSQGEFPAVVGDADEFIPLPSKD
jgi:redox-sensitive bicupin YhaK (pirin superfamily)